MGQDGAEDLDGADQAIMDRVMGQATDQAMVSSFGQQTFPCIQADVLYIVGPPPPPPPPLFWWLFCGWCCAPPPPPPPQVVYTQPPPQSNPLVMGEAQPVYRSAAIATPAVRDNGGVSGTAHFATAPVDYPEVYAKEFRSGDSEARYYLTIPADVKHGQEVCVDLGGRESTIVVPDTVQPGQKIVVIAPVPVYIAEAVAS